MKTTVDVQIAGEFTQHINIARTVITGDLTVLSFLGEKEVTVPVRWGIYSCWWFIMNH